MKILLWLGLSILSAILYRLGGTSAGTKWRDAGCPLVALILYIALKGFNLSFLWVYLLTFGLSWGAMTTYWKRKGTDAKWWNWLLTGLGYSLATLPIAFVTGHWIGFGLRILVLSLLTMFWSEKIDWDVAEEMGRGAIFCLTIPLLTI